MPLFRSMPVASRIYCRVGGEDNMPLFVNDGRKYIRSIINVNKEDGIAKRSCSPSDSASKFKEEYNELSAVISKKILFYLCYVDSRIGGNIHFLMDSYRDYA